MGSEDSLKPIFLEDEVPRNTKKNLKKKKNRYQENFLRTMSITTLTNVATHARKEERSLGNHQILQNNCKNC